MQYILAILYLYLIIYTVYFLVLANRNLKDKAFYLEKKYSMYDDIKNNFAVLGKALCCIREYGEMEEDCLDEIRQDYNSRKK